MLMAMGEVRNRFQAVNVSTKIPPGAFTMRFSQPSDLAATTSGVDCHTTGGRLIKVIALLGTVSSTDVVIGIQKNDVEVFQVTILADEPSAVYDVQKIESEIPMDFVAVTDTLRVQVVTAGTGAKDLTVLAVFDR